MGLTHRDVQVFYCSPDNDHPSWGVAMLYHHVSLLREFGVEAFVIQQREPFRLSWLESDAPVVYWPAAAPRLRADDVLVVPEVFASAPHVLNVACRRVVFVQSCFLIQSGMGWAGSYAQLGYERAVAVMPHVQEVVERFFGVAAEVVPPCVADYCFQDNFDPAAPRPRRVVLSPKPGAEDYHIAARTLGGHLNAGGAPGWEIEELSGKSHLQVAQTLQRAAFLVNVNCRESLNATVAEAMAAGCLPFCYDAYGGSDYLKDGGNAFVFRNNWVFPLLSRLLKVMADYDEMENELAAMRAEAHRTAQRYTRDATRRALHAFFDSLLG